MNKNEQELVSEILTVLYESKILTEKIKNVDGDKMSLALDELYHHLYEFGYPKGKAIPFVEKFYSEMLSYNEEIAKAEFERGFSIGVKITQLK